MESKKRKKGCKFPAEAAILLILIFLSSCEWGIPDYTLTVVVEEGVTGTPAPGKYIHKELTTVEFSYTPINPLHIVEVMLNNRIRKSASGSLVLYGDNYTLMARLVDIRGVWKVKMTWSDSAAVDFEFTMTITGPDLTSGTFTDSRGYNGIWSANADLITFTYLNWGDFVLTGSTFNMQGTFTGEEKTGTWVAERQNSLLR